MRESVQETCNQISQRRQKKDSGPLGSVFNLGKICKHQGHWQKV